MNRTRRVHRLAERGPSRIYVRWAATLLALWLAAIAGSARAEDPVALRNGVVKITSISPEGKRRTGAGFIVMLDPQAGFIVTASHVVEGDKTPQVEFRTHPLAVKAQVKQLDTKLDVALLVVQGSDLRPDLLPLQLDPADSELVGEEVTTIGFPGGLSWALSKPNIASQEGMHLALVGGDIDEGSSGGPVLKDGAVVAMVTAAERNAGRAIPAQFLEFVLRGWRIDVSRVAQTPPQRSAQETGPAPPPASAPQPALTWERAFGPTMAHEIHSTSDGNYILSGYTKQPDERAFDALILKLTPRGSLIWKRSFPTAGDDDLIYSIAEPAEGGYVVGGDKSGTGAWIAALSVDGETRWERTFPDVKAMPWRIRPARDSGVVVAGGLRSPAGGGTQLWLTKLDARGQTLWSRAHSNRQWDKAADAIPFALSATGDGGYLVAVTDGWIGRVWLVKTDGNGIVQWERNLPREGIVFSILETRQGYVLAGAAKSNGSRKAWVARFDGQGNLTWEREFEESTWEGFLGVSETADGGYLLGGDHIVKLDPRGEVVWNRKLEGKTLLLSMERAADGGYIAAGFKNKEVWVLKLDADGRLGGAM